MSPGPSTGQREPRQPHSCCPLLCVHAPSDAEAQVVIQRQAPSLNVPPVCVSTPPKSVTEFWGGGTHNSQRAEAFTWLEKHASSQQSPEPRQTHYMNH